MPPVLELRDLRLVRGETVILDGISWRIERGEHWVILGANGSGKTSLLAALTAYLTPSAGSMEVLGASYGAADFRELRRHIGLVSSSVRQMMPDAEPALETVASGKFAMIQMWCRLKKEDRAEASRILRRMKCAHLAERPWQVLSQGERQRVLIGRALMARPRLMILDEPCAGLDPVARESFLSFTQRLGEASRSPALVLVTHHVEEILPIFSHVLLMKNGTVLAAGPKRSVLSSANLSATFGTTLRLVKTQARYSLRF